MEDKFQKITESAGDIIYTSDRDGVVDYVNPQIEKYGFSMNEVIGKALGRIIFVHPDDRPKVLAERQKAEEAGDSFRLEYRMIDKNGNINWLEESGRVTRDGDGKITGSVVVVRDITQRKKAEEQARLKLSDMKDLVDAAVGRELRMIELEKEVNALLVKLGLEPKY